MRRSVFASLLLIGFFALIFVLKTWRQWRSTGDTGFRGISGRPGSVEWLGGVLFVVGLLCAVAATLTELCGFSTLLVERVPFWMDVLAFSSFFVGMVGTVWAQLAMGASWRIGVSVNERTQLIEKGPFRWVRNPIFSFILLTAVGLVLYLPNLFAITAMLSLILAVELQVRFSEEPYLRKMHGDAYVDYCRRVGRFLPRFGRKRD